MSNLSEIKSIISYHILKMFKYSLGVLPLPVSAHFQYNYVIHTHNTGRSKFVHTPIGRSELATYRTFSYRGAHIWNYISQNVPTDVSYACFRLSTELVFCCTADIGL